MQIITGDNVSNNVDYSFGDHRGLWDSSIIGAFTKYANANNQEFLDKCQEFKGKIMTVYIDNIRLYNRPLQTDTEADYQLVDNLMRTNDLLALCSLLPENGFIIYTGQEDTPIDKHIQIPPNVLQIYAVNGLFQHELVTPFPFGLQRKMTPTDNRLEVMKENVEKDEYTEPSKLLYINMGVERNAERAPLAYFTTNDWTTTRFDKDSRFFPFERYQDFLNELKDHKFIVCPKGHGFDTHRIWESLYSRRVPIMKRHPYFERLLEYFPVLWVDNWYDISKELLELNDHLYQRARFMNMNTLDLDKIMSDNKERYAHQ